MQSICLLKTPVGGEIGLKSAGKGSPLLGMRHLEDSMEKLLFLSTTKDSDQIECEMITVYSFLLKVV